MRFLLYALVLQLVTTSGLARSNGEDDNVPCEKWECLNAKLIKDLSVTDLISKIQNLLPKDWEAAVGAAVNICYNVNETSKSCPGKRFLECFMPQLSKHCPENYVSTSYVCSSDSPRVPDENRSSFMFEELRYYIGEYTTKTLPKGFKRCCKIPQVFNNLAKECGFEAIIDSTFISAPTHSIPYYIENTIKKTSNINIIEEPNGSDENGSDEDSPDPLSCCDINEFIEPSWRSECKFQLKWDNQNRLSIENKTEQTSTSTAAPTLTNKDVKIVPISCEQENCVFSKLNIVSNGTVDKNAFIRLLDNFVEVHTEWSKAKDKVLTLCLHRPLIGYEEQCEINKVLSCTFDVLSENCPNANHSFDPCKHSTSVSEGIICQISSSLYKPKHRRQFCSLPDLTSREVRSECGVNMIYKLEYVSAPQRKSSKWEPVANCKDTTQPAECLLRKMNVLNQYGFIDYFKFYEKIGLYARSDLNSQLLYRNALNDDSLYPKHCSSSKKLLSVIDSMITMCPATRRNDDEKCQRLINLMRPSNFRIQENNIRHTNSDKIESSEQNSVNLWRKKRRLVTSIYKSNPLYNFGIFGGKDEPTVELIDLKTEKTLVLRPVYERYKDNLKSIKSDV